MELDGAVALYRLCETLARALTADRTFIDDWNEVYLRAALWPASFGAARDVRYFPECGAGASVAGVFETSHRSTIDDGFDAVRREPFILSLALCVEAREDGPLAEPADGIRLHGFFDGAALQLWCVPGSSCGLVATVAVERALAVAVEEDLRPLLTRLPVVEAALRIAPAQDAAGP